jgi:hypothetical protein
MNVATAGHWKVDPIAAELGVHRDVSCAIDTSCFRNAGFAERP